MPHEQPHRLTVPEAARAFSLLGNLNRLRLLLVLRDRGEVPVGELSAAIDLPPSPVSNHLALLRRAGLVECCRQGHRTLYRLSSPFAAGMLGLVERG
jgi:ArsR family transcriptional regulator